VISRVVCSSIGWRRPDRLFLGPLARTSSRRLAIEPLARLNSFVV
jgi:hypothetical protein